MSVAPEGETTPKIKGLGGAIKRRRQARHLTQAQLAERAGIHVTYVSHLEAGRSYPGWEVLCALSTALELRLSALIREAEDP